MRTMSMAMPAEPVVVDVDRPFLVVVRHRETGVPYFVARVVHP
jgi:serpin B